MDYKEFLDSKIKMVKPAGFTVSELNSKMFAFQSDVVKWALKKGKAAIFAGTGLGKTLMQTEWAHRVCEHTGGNVLIFAPLAVSGQTVREAAKFGIDVKYCADASDVQHGINITNYERLDKFDISKFDGIVLDESSILKSFTGKVKQKLIDSCEHVPYRLACTATPSPNDFMELGNHAEFLGVMKRSEMLAMYFVHDGSDTSKWRIKGHAVARFWEWVASWAVMFTRPSDIGYADDMYNLPELAINQITVHTEATECSLFAVEALTLQERQQARRDSVAERSRACKEAFDKKSNEQWIVWCNLNTEQDELEKLFGDKCFSIRGQTKDELKVEYEERWRNGERPVLITKPSIFGWGVNWQNCHNMAFVGLSDSFEQYYQAVRRCWRFGQTDKVNVYIITADTEGAVKANIERKEKAFETMLDGMIKATQEITKENIKQTGRQSTYYNAVKVTKMPSWFSKGA